MLRGNRFWLKISRRKRKEKKNTTDRLLLLHTGMYEINILLAIDYLSSSVIKFTWCPEQIDPFGTRTRNGLCTGHDVRGPHRDIPGNGTELKLLLLQGLHIGGSGIGTPLNCIGPGGPITPAAMAAAHADVDGIGTDDSPGPGPWWHIGPPQFGIGHWPPPTPPLWMPPLPQHVSAAKLSWLSEHWSRWGNGGDDCLE